VDTDKKIANSTEDRIRSLGKARDLRYAPACAIDAKKVLDSRFQILVTRCGKRSKKILKLAVFGVQVAALLIDFLATKAERHEENLIADYTNCAEF
jgi:hypothetical protein